MTTLKYPNNHEAKLLARKAMKEMYGTRIRTKRIRALDGSKHLFRIASDLPQTGKEIRFREKTWFLEGFEWLGRYYPGNDYALYAARLKKKDTPSFARDIQKIRLALKKQ